MFDSEELIKNSSFAPFLFAHFCYPLTFRLIFNVGLKIYIPEN